MRIQVPDSLQGLAVSPDGRRIAAGSGPFGTIVSVWEVKSGREIAHIPGHAGRVSAVSFRKGGKSIYSVAEDGLLKEWEGYEYRHVTNRAENTSDYSISEVVAMDRGATRLAFVERSIFADPGDANQIVIWDPANGRTLKKLKGHRDFVSDLAFSAAGNRLVSAGADKTVIVWDLGTGKSLRPYTGHTSSVTQAAPGPDGTWVVSSENAKPDVRVWDVATGNDRYVFRGHTESVLRLAVSPDGTQVASTSVFNLKVWNPADGTIFWSFKLPTGEALAVEFSPNGENLVVITDHRVICLDARTGRVLYSHESKELQERAAVAFTPDSKRLITASQGIVRLWETRTGQEVFTLTGDKPGPLFAGVATDGRVIRVGLRDCRVIT